MSAEGHKVLVVDDEDGMRLFLKEVLLKEGYRVTEASGGREAVQYVKDVSDFKVVVIDVRMPDLNGIDALMQIKGIDERIVPIILTAYGEEKMDIDILKNGKGTFLTKPVDIDTVRAAVRQSIQQYEEGLAKAGMPPDRVMTYSFRDIIGESQKMLEVRQLIRDIAETDVTVLIFGESGTGKELVARAIHASSTRKDASFVGLNCSAIPETLLESELFGHEKGAFTGADKEKPGKFEVAEGGTLFLDEVADMNLLTQAKVLRVLQEREFERVGGSVSIKIDVRVIAATNKNLEEEVSAKRFREDLYYRLNVVPVYLPPLRERKEDIPLLINHFIEKFGEKLAKPATHISVEAIECLMNYPWPGNIRELENVIQRSLVLSKDNTIAFMHLPDKLKQSCCTTEPEEGEGEHVIIPLSELTDNIIGEMEKKMILRALEKAGGNRQKAAEILKVSRMTLYNKLKKYDISE
ncbi:MAG: sigma-54-dependent Fis family transcriptional regulator [Candidatus Omnitrophica bacterium]|nr:sigma-54-dependent Fis family transcriptional regulator [Candidatus Omnitrophota bacterium]